MHVALYYVSAAAVLGRWSDVAGMGDLAHTLGACGLLYRMCFMGGCVVTSMRAVCACSVTHVGYMHLYCTHANCVSTALL